jgi:hypothetical protein
MNRIVLSLAVVSCSVAAAQTVYVSPPQPPSVRVQIAPPAPRVEMPPPAPSMQHIWVAGYWSYSGGRYVWMSGHYELRPQPSATWVSARWVARNGGWYFEPGHWSATVTAPPPAPAPQPVAVAPPPQPQASVVSAKQIAAGSVRARVIYVKDLKARNGRVGQVIGVDDRSWERGRTDSDLRMPEIAADTIYAKEIKTDWIEADVVYAKEARIAGVKYGR